MTDRINEERLMIDLAKVSCDRIVKDNPLRVVVSVGYLYDVLVSVEKYLDDYKKIIDDFIKDHDTLNLSKVAELHNELEMYAKLAREKLGVVR